MGDNGNVTNVRTVSHMLSPLKSSSLHQIAVLHVATVVACLFAGTTVLPSKQYQSTVEKECER
jgi:hypothetical protein